MLLTEAQSDRTIEVGRKGPMEIIWSNPPASAGPYKSGYPGPCPGGFLVSPKRNHESGQPVPVLSHPHSDKVFPIVQREPPVFQSVSIASGPVTGHHLEEPGSVLFAPSLQVCIHVDKIPLSLLLSKLNSPSSLSFSSQARCSNSLTFSYPSLDSPVHLSLHVCLVLGSTALTQYSRCDLICAE